MTIRADEALVEAGFAPDIERARAFIMEGRVLSGARKLNKPSDVIKRGAPISVLGDLNAYVSRGALKLRKAMDVFQIDVAGKCCLDVGASTGGFTDVMLREGARKVFAVDVGYNLLDWRLRSDARVVSMERVNARFISREMFDEAPEFGATDVSFISLKAVLPAVRRVLAPGARFVALIKPQFEARREEVGEKGVVRDENVHHNVVESIVRFAEMDGWRVIGLDYSPIKGAEGNIEFLLYLALDTAVECSFDYATINATIRSAYDKLIK